MARGPGADEAVEHETGDEELEFAPSASGPIIVTRRFWKHASYLAVGGIVVQAVLATLFLGFGHAPSADDLPIGIVAEESVRTPMTTALEDSGALDVTAYVDRAAVVSAIGDRELYGAIVITSDGKEILVASAAGPLAANLLRRLPTSAPEQLGDAVITDVAPLPASDSNGGSLALILQVLVMGGSLASLGLGRLLPGFRAPVRRGVLPVTFLAVYALVSAGAMLGIMKMYGVGTEADHLELFGVFALLSLSITASVSAAVAMLGPLGSAITGGLYFLLGVPLSGASLPPDFLPTGYRVLGQALPTGGGADAIRSVMYFGDHAAAHGIGIMALYAGIGTIILMVLNFMDGRAHVHHPAEPDNLT